MLPPGLRCFLAVAQSGSMREAANRLRLAQSAVSRRIQLLEEELGLPLLERGARGVALTPAGEILLEHGREALLQDERLRAGLDALRGIRRGHVVLRCVASFGAAELPGVVAEFQAAHPAVTLDIGVEGSESVMLDVRERRCHLGVAFNPAADPDAEVLASAVEPIMAVVAPTHPLAGRADLSLKDVAPYPVIMPTRLGRVRQLVDAACGAARVELHSVLETNSTHLIAAIVAGGRAVSIMSPRVLALHRATGRVIFVPLADRNLNSGRLVLVARRGRRLPGAASAMAAALAAAIEKRPDLPP
ncbi:LysR family transcriptional regulator [Falsiroseomonas sp. CW058]|uniref:LysR family transcriptional regulator n=1 Tax=Falsiroseomonas sp. CW058 TaxID=3388664 RepID=UPI003D31BF68